MFSLARALPSPSSAEDCSSLFGWFIGTTAQSDSSGACMLALWLWAFANRSRSSLDPDAPEVSRFSCMLFLSVRGFLDYAGPADHSRLNAASRFAFLPLGTESAPCSSVFRSAIARPTNSPDLRFAQHLAMLIARLGAKMDSLLLSCTTLSFATTCRFIPAHPVKRRSRAMRLRLLTGMDRDFTGSIPEMIRKTRRISRLTLRTDPSRAGRFAPDGSPAANWFS